MGTLRERTLQLIRRQNSFKWLFLGELTSLCGSVSSLSRCRKYTLGGYELDYTVWGTLLYWQKNPTAYQTHTFQHICAHTQPITCAHKNSHTLNKTLLNNRLSRTHSHAYRAHCILHKYAKPHSCRSVTGACMPTTHTHLHITQHTHKCTITHVCTHTTNIHRHPTFLKASLPFLWSPF